METRILNVHSGEVYANRKEAKLMMGHGEFNRALRTRDVLFLSLYGLYDVII